MILSNFYNALYASVSNAQCVGVVTNYSGTVKNAANYYQNNPFRFLNNWFTSTSSAEGIAFGDGTTPVSESDYKLAGTLLTTSKASVTFSRTSATDASNAQLSVLITNNSSSDITIAEIGWIASVTVTIGSSSDKTPVLFDRTVLDEPLVIAAGQKGRIEYTINFAEGREK